MKWIGPGASVLGSVLILLAATCYAGYHLVAAFAQIQGVTVTIEYDIAKILGVILGGIAIPTAIVGYARYRNTSSKG